MTKMHLTLGLAAIVLLPSCAMAQGLVGGAEQGARRGEIEAGSVGAVVGGAVGAASGTVNGVLGVGGRDPGCASRTVTRTDAAGNSETVRRTNCP